MVNQSESVDRQFSQERFRSEWRSFFKRVGLQVP